MRKPRISHVIKDVLYHWLWNCSLIGQVPAGLQVACVLLGTAKCRMSSQMLWASQGETWSQSVDTLHVCRGRIPLTLGHKTPIWMDSRGLVPAPTVTILCFDPTLVTIFSAAADTSLKSSPFPFVYAKAHHWLTSESLLFGISWLCPCYFCCCCCC